MNQDTKAHNRAPHQTKAVKRDKNKERLEPEPRATPWKYKRGTPRNKPPKGAEGHPMNQDKEAHGRSPGAAQQTAPKESPGQSRSSQPQIVQKQLGSKLTETRPRSTHTELKKGHPNHLRLRAFGTRKNSNKIFSYASLFLTMATTYVVEP